MSMMFFFFFFNDTATTEIYTLSLHDALPISVRVGCEDGPSGRLRLTVADTGGGIAPEMMNRLFRPFEDRKSTRLNSSHLVISYAVFCLKKKKTTHAARLAREAGLAPGPVAAP